MKTISRTMRMLAVTALAANVLLSQALASPIVSVSPASTDINVGDPAKIDIIVSGLTQALGGFSFVLGFDNTILATVDYTPNPSNLMGAVPLDLSGGFAGGSLDVFYVADMNAIEAALAAGQGASFTLATVNFKGSTNGLSPLTLTGVELSNFTGGATIEGVGVRNGEICVGGNCAHAPEPATLLLLGGALGALGIIRRRKQVA